MKKLKLRALSLGAKEILSREQLKSIVGAGCDEDASVCMGYPCVDGFCDTGSTWGAGSPGSGNGNCSGEYIDCVCSNGRGRLGCMTQSECDLREPNDCD